MKALKIVAITLGVYVGLVVTFESLLGFFQPAGEDTLVIITTDESGSTNDRVLAHLQSGGQTYVAANHWPRAWYNQALENPKVEAVIAGNKAAYLAVPISDQEDDRVRTEHAANIAFRLLTGFPPRYFLRLDPR